ncbi:MAG: YlbF family regulator [Erysipelotrichales bacterium]
MNAAEYKAIQINKILKETDTYKLYDKTKKSLSSKYELQEQEIKELQQELVELAHNDEVAFDLKKSEYLSKKEVFASDPLIKTFIKAYKDLRDEISNIQALIEVGVK